MEMNLTFELDGRMEKLGLVREKCNCIKMILEEKLKTKLMYGATYDGDVQFNVYVNDYDYYSIFLNINDYYEGCEVINMITFMLENRTDELDFYKAPMVEKCIVDLLQENETEDIYIFDGILCYEGLEFVLKDIKEYHVYNDEECIMRIYDELDGWYTIDFDNGIIEEEVN